MHSNDQETPTARIRERLAETLAEWGSEFTAVLEDLERARKALAERDNRVAELTAELDDRDNELAELGKLRKQQQSYESALAKRDAELSDLCDQLKNQHASNEELAAKLEAAEQARQADQHREAELARIRRQKKQADDQVAELLEQVRMLRETADEEASGGASEIAALQAELDARKILVRNLRADAERANALETLLEEKNAIVETLEESINRHAETIAELKRSADYWKAKYRNAYGDFGATTTITRPAMPRASAPAPAQSQVRPPAPPLAPEKVDAAQIGSENRSDSEISGDVTVSAEEDSAEVDARQIAELLEASGDPDGEDDVGDRTVAIDMRQALVEARRAAGKFNRKD